MAFLPRCAARAAAVPLGGFAERAAYIGPADRCDSAVTADRGEVTPVAVDSREALRRRWRRAAATRRHDRLGPRSLHARLIPRVGGLAVWAARCRSRSSPRPRCRSVAGLAVGGGTRRRRFADDDCRGVSTARGGPRRCRRRRRARGRARGPTRAGGARWRSPALPLLVWPTCTISWTGPMALGRCGVWFRRLRHRRGDRGRTRGRVSHRRARRCCFRAQPAAGADVHGDVGAVPMGFPPPRSLGVGARELARWFLPRCFFLRRRRHRDSKRIAPRVCVGGAQDALSAVASTRRRAPRNAFHLAF
jgi:hypothetical protein